MTTVDPNTGVVRYTEEENDDGESGTSTFSAPGVKEFAVGHRITDDEAQAIADNSDGLLTFENGHLVGQDAEGNEVDVDTSQPITESDIHVLHHVSLNFGGKNDDMGFMDGHSGSPPSINNHDEHHH
jgi:hypothetical protein